MPDRKIFTFANALKFFILAAIICLWYLMVRYVLSKAAFVGDSVFYAGSAVITVLYVYFLRSISGKPISKREYSIHMLFSAGIFFTGFVFCLVSFSMLTGIFLMLAGILHFMWVSGDNPAGTFSRNIGFSSVLYIVGIILCFKGLWAFVGIVAVVLGYLGVKRTCVNFEKDRSRLYRPLTRIMFISVILIPLLGVFSGNM